MNVYIEAHSLKRWGTPLVLALLTWKESKEDRRVVVHSSDEADARDVGEELLDRCGIPFKTESVLVGCYIVEEGEGDVILVEPLSSPLALRGNLCMNPDRFIELMSSDCDLDFECSRCGSFFSVLPFLETEHEAYCSRCAPQLSLFGQEVM